MFGNGQRELLQLGQWRGKTVTSFVNFVKRKKIIDIILPSILSAGLQLDLETALEKRNKSYNHKLIFTS